MAQQFKELMSLLTDMIFRWKDGTHKTLSNVIFELNGMVPVEVNETQEPGGKLTMGIFYDWIVLKAIESEVMWLVAPLYKIQGLLSIKFTEGLRKGTKPAKFA